MPTGRSWSSPVGKAGEMESSRFDSLARGLAERRSRRSALRSLLGGAAGGAAALAGVSLAEAAGKGKIKTDCCPTTAPTLCGHTCTDTINDPANCGGCGAPCAGTCSGGGCTQPQVCAPGSNGGACSAGIGACARSGSLICNAGGTGYDCNAVPGQPTTETCNGIDDDCDGVVDNGFDTQTDINNCGACGHQCSAPNATMACQAGACVLISCAQGTFSCNGNAADGCECVQQSASTCGFDGTCNGQYCGYYGAGTVCAPATCLDASTLQAASICNGSGTCVHGATTNCPNGCSSTTNACNP